MGLTPDLVEAVYSATLRRSVVWLVPLLGNAVRSDDLDRIVD